MKHAKPEKPIIYWACPLGDARVSLDRRAFRPDEAVLAMLDIEPGPWLFYALPKSQLELFEAMVERHEAEHSA